MSLASIIVVGAGPVGSIAALAAARRGFDVTLVEAEVEPDEAPRAATFHAATIEMVTSLGIEDQFFEHGLIARYFDYWDRPTGKLVARMDHDVLRNDTKYPFAVQLEQHILTRIVREELKKYPNATQVLAWRAIGVEQDSKKAHLTVEREGETQVLSADWIVAADGGRSAIRKALEIEFEGYTWPASFLGLTTTRDLTDFFDFSYRNYLADPEDWLAVFKVHGNDRSGWWRILARTLPEESDEAAMSDESVERHLGQIFGGEKLPFIYRKVYNVHQRVAKSFRQSRVFLAGDSAHINNPLGGLGLNGGIHDVMELMEILEQTGNSTENEHLLDRYERRRKSLNIEFIQAQTIENKKNIEETDPIKRTQHLDNLAAIAADEEKTRQFLLPKSLLLSVEQAKQIN